jgi:hypothetical protein
MLRISTDIGSFSSLMSPSRTAQNGQSICLAPPRLVRAAADEQESNRNAYS